jgi:hypothetical protein
MGPDVHQMRVLGRKLFGYGRSLSCIYVIVCQGDGNMFVGMSFLCRCGWFCLKVGDIRFFAVLKERGGCLVETRFLVSN